ncbi:cell wall hydrolase [Dethiobacter alkaliphilus]|uniref:cell wall hydrolase n=1 Tax=Dethiobacter alkaliphilus TaxID=427926 RepID=UPI0022262371|nr:cell wall hydrolase [Dethiobacter alkaliphilus]MCW3488845.1 cell wall hydrolase [Dethiobacter alkaliphilus]
MIYLIPGHAEATTWQPLSQEYTDGALNPFTLVSSSQRSLIGQCTWFVYGRIQEKGLITYSQLNPHGKPPLFRRDASLWINCVNEHPELLSLETDPQPGDIAVWYKNRQNHVAFVEDVVAGEIRVTESNLFRYGSNPSLFDSSSVNKVIFTRPMNFREQPRLENGNVIYSAPWFTVMEVVGGPQVADGKTWYQLKDENGTTGWVAWAVTGYVCNYTGIQLEPKAPVLGRPDAYIRINSSPQTRLSEISQPAAAIDSWYVEPRQAAVGEAIKLSLALSNRGEKQQAFVAGALLSQPDGETVVLEEDIILNPGQSRVISWNHTLSVPGGWAVQFGIWQQKPLSESDALVLSPARKAADYITAILEKPATPFAHFPGTSVGPGQIINTLAPYLEWDTVAEADYYQVWISKYPYGEQNIIYSSGSVEQTKHQVPPGKLEDGTRYRWNMAAFNNAGQSYFSNHLYFQVEQNAPDDQVTDKAWDNWQQIVDDSIQVEYYSPLAGRMVKPWVFGSKWPLPVHGADYEDVQQLRSTTGDSVFVNWTQSDWHVLCKNVGEKELLARLIHAEAGGEGRAGWEAVAGVVLNRLNHPLYPDSVCEIIFEQRTWGVPQFCGILSPRFLQYDNEQVRQGILEVTELALAGQLEDVTRGSVLFHNPSLVYSPYHEYREEALVIGGHAFAGDSGLQAAHPEAVVLDELQYAYLFDSFIEGAGNVEIIVEKYFEGLRHLVGITYARGQWPNHCSEVIVLQEEETGYKLKYRENVASRFDLHSENLMCVSIAETDDKLLVKTTEGYAEYPMGRYILLDQEKVLYSSESDADPSLVVKYDGNYLYKSGTQWSTLKIKDNGIDYGELDVEQYIPAFTANDFVIDVRHYDYGSPPDWNSDFTLTINETVVGPGDFEFYDYGINDIYAYSVDIHPSQDGRIYLVNRNNEYIRWLWADGENGAEIEPSSHPGWIEIANRNNKGTCVIWFDTAQSTYRIEINGAD